MQASSNNHSRTPLPFTDRATHSNKFSEDDTGYESQPNTSEKQLRLSSSPSPSNHQCDRILSLVKTLPSPTDVSTCLATSELALMVASRLPQFPRQSPPARKFHRTRVQPLPDSTSDSADSFAVSNHLMLVSPYDKQLSRTATLSSNDMPSFGGSLDYIHDDRFDSTTTVDHVKTETVAIQLIDSTIKPSAITPSIRLFPTNVLTVVSVGLIAGLLVSAVLVLLLV